MKGSDEQACCAIRRTGGGQRACRWGIRLVLGTAGVACLTGCRAQPTKSYGIRPAEITNVGGHVDFIVRSQERELRSKTSASKTRSEETIFEESVTLETEGYLLHPNIIDLALAGTFGLVQEDFRDEVDGRKRETSDDGDLYEFDVHAQFLKKRTYPTSVFAKRRRGIVPRPFLPRLETTTTSYGLTWQYVNKKNPVSLQFSHVDARLSPLLVSGQPDDEGRQKNTEFRLEASHHFSDHNVLTLNYEYESFEEQPFDFNYDSDEITLTHRLKFGAKQQHRVRSEFNYLDQRGTIDIERFRWREDLWLKHSDTLQSQFQFEALDRTRGNRSSDVPNIEERSIYLSGLLRHQLFQSQTTQFRLFVRKQEFEPDLEVTRWGGHAGINYRKMNRWGVLNANYTFRVERDDFKGSSRTTEVIDDVHTFQDPEPATLSNRNVNVGSITVRAEDRVTFYQRGLDFSLQTIGNTTEIHRIPTGRIADGETVLIDYIFNAGGTYTLDTVAHNLAIQQDFEFGLTPYFRYEWQDQSISPSDATGAIVEDITGYLAGVEYRKRSLRLFAEYEDHDSTINPFVGTRLGGSYTHRFKFGAETSLHTRWTDISHGEPNDRDIKLFTLEGRYRHAITPSLTVEGSVLYRNGEDSASRDTEGVDVSLSLEWFVRETKIRVSFERNEFEDEFSENDSSALFVHVRRGL
ncbi:MAG: hypothetical protein ACYTFA_10070 [Planctomycetota bacterium]